MAYDIANIIYNMALLKEKEDIAKNAVRIEIIHGFIEGYEVSKNILLYKTDEKTDVICMKYDNVVVSSDIFSYTILAQRILVEFLEIFSKQERSDCFISEFCYLIINIRKANNIVASCRYVFKTSLNIEYVLDYNSWYTDLGLCELRHFLSTHFYFAHGIIASASHNEKSLRKKTLRPRKQNMP